LSLLDMVGTIVPSFVTFKFAASFVSKLIFWKVYEGGLS
jgi:hypothetical protein